jgi:hypothetical protein
MKGKSMADQNKTVLDAAAMGRLFIVGEYRGGVATEFSGDDKKTGRRRSYKKVQYTVETGGPTWLVTEFLPDDTDLKTWKPSFQKGDKVIVDVTAAIPNKGRLDVSGKLQKAA